MMWLVRSLHTSITGSCFEGGVLLCMVVYGTDDVL